MEYDELFQFPVVVCGLISAAAELLRAVMNFQTRSPCILLKTGKRGNAKGKGKRQAQPFGIPAQDPARPPFAVPLAVPAALPAPQPVVVPPPAMEAPVGPLVVVF